MVHVHQQSLEESGKSLLTILDRLFWAACNYKLYNSKVNQLGGGEGL